MRQEVKFKEAFSGQKQFWTNENPFKLIKNALYFTFKTFVL